MKLLQSKSLHILLSIALLLLPSLRCQSPSGSRSSVTFWSLGAEGEQVEKLIPEFERRNPGIRVRVQRIPWTAAHEKLLTAYAGESMPDLCQLGNTWIPEFVLLNAIEQIDARVDRSTVIKKESYFPGIWETNIIGDGLFGIPWYVDTRVLFYRTDILAKMGFANAPRTWDELLAVSRKIKANLHGAEAYAILLPSNEWAPQVVFGMQAGSSLLRDGDRYGAFSGKAFMTALDFYVNFFQEDLAPTSLIRMRDVFQGFADGYFAMYITGPWNVGEFQRRLPEVVRSEWMTAPLPGFDGMTPGVSLAGGSSLVIFSSSTRKAEAWKLIEYLSEPEQQVTFYRLTGDLPARREAWEDSSLSRNPYAQAFFSQLQHVQPMPRIPEWEQIAMKIQQYSELASMGRMSVEKALAALDEDVNVILEKRRWLLGRP